MSKGCELIQHRALERPFSGSRQAAAQHLDCGPI